MADRDRGGYQGRGGRGGRGGPRGGRGGEQRGGYRGGRGRGEGPTIAPDRTVVLETNMYPVKLNNVSVGKMRRYEVGFFSTAGETRAITSKRVRRMIITQLSKILEKQTPIAFDGMFALFSLEALKPIDNLKPSQQFYSAKKAPSPEAPMKMDVTIGQEPRKGEQMVSSEEVKLAVGLANVNITSRSIESTPPPKLDPTSIHYVVNLPDEARKTNQPGSGQVVVQCREVSISNEPEARFQMLQVILQFSYFCFHSNAIIRGSNVFLLDHKKLLPKSDLDLFEGIFQSFRSSKMGPVLNLNVSYLVALGAHNIHDWFILRAQNAGYRSLPDAFNDNFFREKLKREIKGMEVRVLYGNKRKYKVDGIEYGLNAVTAEFEDSATKTKMNITTYVNSKYKMKVKYDKDPLLIIRKKTNNNADNVTYLLPELCCFTEAQKRRTQLSPEERAMMIDATRTTPDVKFEKISNLAKHIAENKYLQRFPLQIEAQDPVTIKGKVLSPQVLEYSKSVKEAPSPKGSWNLKDKAMAQVQPGPITWVLIFPASMQKETFNGFLDSVRAVSVKSGMNLAPPVNLRCPSDSVEDYRQSVKKCGTLKPPPRFILVLLPDSKADRHDAVKNAADLEVKIPSKCMVLDPDKSLNHGVIGNVLASINSKLGGQNWVVPIDNIKSWAGANKLCVMGLDVCHGNTADDSSSSGSGSANSVVALCASYNDNFTKYYTALRYQSSRQEVVVDISFMVTECLSNYEAKNKTLPSHILFYRDGVGEGMYDQVLRIEVQQIKNAVGELYSAKKQPMPKLTLLVVQKRNHFRARVEEYYNPPVGTYIDEQVVDSSRDNFYLYSHYALQGTAKPTHYQILLDECGFKNQLIPFTYALAHLHQGCPRSISIPAPVFYADKACGRALQYYQGAKAIPLTVQDGMMI